MPKISVIVPAYNVEQYLEKCIHSIINQTFSGFEVLLIDDGARDDTPGLCDLIARQDNRIRVFHKENGGLSDARNYGIDRAVGEYLTFVDSDDYVSGDYLNDLYCRIMKKNADISICQGQVLLEDEEPKKNGNVIEKEITSEEAVKMMLLRREATHTSWGKLYKASLWRNIRFPKGQNYEDYATTYHVFANAKTVAYSSVANYYYIQRNGSIMHENCSKKTLSVLDVSDNVSAFLLKKWPKCKMQIFDLQAHTYMKNMQMILNTGLDAFPEYQAKIMTFVKNNAKELLFSDEVPRNDKIKVFSLLLGRKIFLRIYNSHDGNRKV